jgi:hypothetical protein
MSQPSGPPGCKSSTVLGAVKDALRAPLRGGLRPSLTAPARGASPKPGRDGGMVLPIEQRNNRG